MAASPNQRVMIEEAETERTEKEPTEVVHPPRKREYKVTSLKKQSRFIPASLLKVETEYFHTIKD